MCDLISRSALLEDIKNIKVKIDYDALNKLVEVSKDEDVLKTIIKYVIWQSSEIVMKHIDELPAVEAKPVVHGEWLSIRDKDKKKCSECEVIHLIAQYPRGNANFCPNCGADMRKKENKCK